MDRLTLPALPTGPLGSAGLSSLQALQYKAKNPAAQRHNLARVCSEVEGVFLSQLMQQMRRTFVQSVDPRQKRTDYYQLCEQQVAQALAAGGGLGLARRLFEDLQNRIPAHPKEHPEEKPQTEPSPGNPDPAGDIPVPGTPGMSGTGSPSPDRSSGGDHPGPGGV